MTDRRVLYAQLVEISGNRCEHPMGEMPRCPEPMAEMAHIVPRGMGHKGDRDTIYNVMAACKLHARSTDDLSSPEWLAVRGWHSDFMYVGQQHLMTKRQALAHAVNARRRMQGVDLEATARD